jgi:hypothetical protein
MIPMDQIKTLGDYAIQAGPYIGGIIILMIVWEEWK